LKGKISKSCGCLRKETSFKHGDYKDRLYQIWADMKTRCSCKTTKNYKDYGGRGIKFYNKWINYLNFKEWAINNGYKNTLTIERKNNNKGYNPKNCVFIPRSENSKHTRRCRFWYIKRKKFNSSIDAAKYFNVSKDTIRNWCNKHKEGCYSERKYK
jgi:hypothetical protein